MFKKSKKIIAVLLAALMLAALLASCSGGDGDTSSKGSSSKSSSSKSSSSQASSLSTEPKIRTLDDAKEITLKVWGPATSLELLQKQCDDFKKLYPDKTINIECTGMGEDESKTKLLNDPDSAADILAFASDHLLLLEKNLNPVPDYIKTDIIATNLEASVDACTIDDELIAYPETADNSYILVYDKRVVSDEQAKKFEDILTACDTANKSFIMDGSNGYYSCIFPFTGGMTVDINEDKDTQILNYEEQKVVDSLKAFATTFRAHKSFQSGNPTSLVSGFKPGVETSGAGIAGTWEFEAIKAHLGDNFGFAKLPTININGTDTQMVNMFGYKMLGVNSKTKYPFTAAALAEYLTNTKSQIERCKELGFGPSNLTAREDESYTSNKALVAISDQQQYSVIQLNLLATFWDPMGGLGAYLVNKDNSLEDAALKTELKNMKDIICE